jgi:mono/diheme cytochrome c family protein
MTDNCYRINLLKGVALLALVVSPGGFTASAQTSKRAAKPVVQDAAASAWTAADAQSVATENCVICHNLKSPSGGFRIEGLDFTKVDQRGETFEKIVRKLRGGTMPPIGMPRPDPAEFEGWIRWMENELDRKTRTALPAPGIHRMNRTEYKNAIKDLLGLEIDPSRYLPSDDSTRGFDNVAAALTVSPALLEGYMSAAGKLSRVALGTAKDATVATYRAPEDTSQDYHIDGLPFNTRGGLVVNHEFPADGEYLFKVWPISLGNMNNNRAFGDISGEKLELLIDGELIKTYDWDKEVGRGRAVVFGTPDFRIKVKAGLHTVAFTFLARNDAPGNDLNKHFLRATIETGGLPGYTFYPHVGKMSITGPENAAVPADSPSRSKIFVCKPTTEATETACAKQIVSTLGRRAFRRPMKDSDVETLMSFYQEGRNTGKTFDAGIEMALRRILADPEFVFRKEVIPATAKPGEKYRISDTELASRLAFFLWSSVPDDELLKLAAANRLRVPVVLEAQVKRMLSDSRSDRLVENLAGQWFQLRALATQSPVTSLYPDFDDNLRYALRQEAELFIKSVVHEDRSVRDLLDGNYTFLNERLAKHYGIPYVKGSYFRRVELGPEFDMRRGMIGKGAIAAITSYPQRTSPVVRGKTVMKMFLGVDPPQPPPNVPGLDATKNASPVKLTMRQQMEMHRSNPYCAACHKMLDPIGFVMEQFDAIGAYRTHEDGMAIDPKGQLVDGTQLNGVTDLRNALLKQLPLFARVTTDNMMIYALGRGTEYFDMPVVRKIVADAAKVDYRFSSIVLGIVKSDQFQMNMKPAGEQLASK